MSNVVPIHEELRQIRSAANAPPGGPGGGGTDDDVPPRVTRLEDDMKELKADLKKALSDLAYLRGKADSALTTLQLIAFAVAIFAAAGVTRLFGH